MIKITKVEIQNQLLCHFANKEVRLLNLTNSINDKYAEKILSNNDIFKSVKIGSFGEIYWADATEIVDYNGDKIPCAYDISPEFAYANSEPV